MGARWTRIPMVLVWLAVAAIWPAIASSQTTKKDAKAKAKPAAVKEESKAIALLGGKVVTVAGRTLRRGTVLIRGGKIEAVGDDVVVPEDAEVVDCRGKVITPGFIPAIAWGVGMASGRSGFESDDERSVDEPHRDHEHVAGHAHGPVHTGSFLAHAHGPLCLCSHLNWVYEVQRSDRTAAEKLRLFLPDDALVVQASVIRLTTFAHPFLEGLTEIELFDPDLATNAVKDRLDPFGRSLVFMNAAGITSAWIPGEGSIPVFALLFGMVSPPPAGTSGIFVKFSRDRLDEMYVESGRFLVADFRRLAGVKRQALFQEIEDTVRYQREKAAYDKAKAEYTKAKARYRADKKAKKKVGPEPKAPRKVKKPSTADKWIPLLDRKRALRVWAETVPQIRLALAIADRHGIELVLDSAVEGWAIADEIARSRASVVLNPRRVVPVTRVAVRPGAPIYRHGSSIENAAILSRHGVKVSVLPPAPAIVTMGIAGRDLLTLPLDAAFAVRGGFPRDEAIKALTLYPAEVLGVADRVGTLEVGKDADVLVLDGDPLDHKTFVERTYVNGRLVYEKAAEPLFDHVKRGKLVKPIWEWPKPGG